MEGTPGVRYKAASKESEAPPIPGRGWRSVPHQTTLGVRMLALPGATLPGRIHCTYNLQADESSGIGTKDVWAGGKGDPGCREGHGRVRGRRDWRSAGRHAAAGCLCCVFARPSASRAPAAAGAAGVRRVPAQREGAWPSCPGPTGPRPVTWAQVSAAQVKCRGATATWRGTCLLQLSINPSGANAQRSWSV